MILELKAIFKDKLKARRTYREIEAIQKRADKELSVNLLTKENTTPVIGYFDTRSFLKTMFWGAVIGFGMGVSIFLMTTTTALEQVWMEMVFASVVGAMGGIITAFMMFFIWREYKIFLAPNELKDDPAVISVVCHENYFTEIEKILRAKRPSRLLTS